jgi:hypothetical protein
VTAGSGARPRAGLPWRAGSRRVASGSVPTQPGRLVLAGLAIAVVGSIGACSIGATATPAPSSVLPPSPVDGVVVAVDSAGLANVKGFTLRLTGGATVTLTLGTLVDATAFAPGHLAEHEATGAPVRAWFVVSDGVPVVYRLEDAVAASPSSSP